MTRGYEASATQRVCFLDYFRIPYAVHSDDAAADVGRLDVGGGPTLLWARAGGTCGSHRLGSIPIFGHVLPDDAVQSVFARAGGQWSRAQEIVDRAGVRVASIWRSADGDAFLPFDPDEAIANLLSERYLTFEVGGVSRHVRTVARTGYYWLRPLLPRSTQISMRRRFSRIQERARFPEWPIETGLHDLYAFLLGLLDELAGGPLPRIAAWPDGRTWALVLTHDVEMTPGYKHLEPMLGLERARGYRSAWYFVPERDYAVEERVIEQLVEEGFEVGVQGLRHDGRDLAPRRFDRRVAAMRMYAWRWNASGFRSPATHRNWELMPRLGFDYDTSYSDVARYEPQPGGCCSWLPFFIHDLVELPLTLPMDHTLFELLEQRDGASWIEKTRFLESRGGMALLLTHPDYMLSRERLEAYASFLEAFDGNGTVWHVLPREVSAWWRRRAESRIERDGDDWRVVGPAADEARIELGPLPA